MKNYSLKEFCKTVNGTMTNFTGQSFSNISTDTRTCMAGDLFLAFQGDNYDAHEFLSDALAKNVSALVVSDKDRIPDKLQSCAVILVANTLQAYQDWASFIRVSSGSKYIAITGSNGKTTTKRFLKSLLGESVFVNKASFNNHWGVPWTLIHAGHEFEKVVVEIGMNHAGEIEHLIQLTHPDIVCLTNIGNAHLEFFASPEKLAEAKEESYQFSPGSAVAVFNIDDLRTKRLLNKYQDHFEKCFTFSTMDESADVMLKSAWGEDLTMTISGRVGSQVGSAVVPIIGQHNCMNLAAASACALASGVLPEDIWNRMPGCRSEWGRLMLVKCGDGNILFDAYNANPDSFSALIDTISQVRFNRVFGVFGHMAELGDRSGEWHDRVGKELSGIVFEKIFFVGPHREDFARGYSRSAELLSDNDPSRIANMMENLKEGDLVVVKGSRSARLEDMFPTLPAREN